MTAEIASIEFELEWQSSQATHRDRTFFPKVNFWRDIFPVQLEAEIDRLLAEKQAAVKIEPGKLVEPFNPKKVYRVSRARLKNAAHGEGFLAGRFYPCGLLSDIGFPKEDLRPCRVIAADEESLEIDTNHPLSSTELTLTARLVDSLTERHMRGGSSNDIAYLISGEGPGFQAEHPAGPTDFMTDDPYFRQDSGEDPLFYREPRLLNHVDTVAGDHIAALYSRLLEPGTKTLDLMSSWNSHLQHSGDSLVVSGLGMNQAELQQNSVLAERVIQDLNINPVLPFEDGEFEACICSLSVEYLTQPDAVVREVGRVLKKGAPFVVTFSDRWFESKVTKVWTDLHAFERMGLVTAYFKNTGVFAHIQTESVRGYLRPEDDLHISERQESDPVFAVWGCKN